MQAAVTGKVRGGVLAAGAALALAVGAAAGLPSNSEAHGTSHCLHGDIYNGGWVSYYQNHYGSTGSHYNWYYHFLDGYFQHREDNLCG